MSLVTFMRGGRTLGVVGVARTDDALRELMAFFDSLRPTPAVAEETPAAPVPGRESGIAPTGIRDTDVPIEPGTIVDGRPAGLFYRVEVDLTGGQGAETTTWLFLPDHRVSRFHPLGGSGLFDPSRCNPDTCGTFEITAEQLLVRWDDGHVQRWAFSATPDEIRLDGREFRRARAVPVESLVGQWSDGQPGAGGMNVYTFDGDGRFSFGNGRNALTGTYRILGLTLTLTFSDGDVRGRTLFAASTQAPVGLISVDGTVYARR